MFFHGSNAKSLPDEKKWAKIVSFRWAGGAEWRAMWEGIRPALDGSLQFATPPVRATHQPDLRIAGLPISAGDAGGTCGTAGESSRSAL